MENNAVIQVNGVSKKFCRSLKRSMWYGFHDILRDTSGLRPKSDRLRRKEFWAIDDVSFELRKGESLGLIGPNGAGKTTILKMLNGIVLPDKGNLRIKGRVGALIQLGAGFHPQLTGRENIYINGAILGMGKREIDKKFDAIVEFADIGDFLNTPVKFYSSGMFVRLGFAVAVHCEPQILLVDEVLAVGDVEFQRKCFEKLYEMRRNNTSVVLVSHHMPKIGSYCERAMFIRQGKVVVEGNPAKVIDEYERQILKYKNWSRIGNVPASNPIGGVQLIDVRYENAERRDGKLLLQYDKPIIVSFSYDCKAYPIDDICFSLLVYRKSDGCRCFAVSSHHQDCYLREKKGVVNLTIERHKLLPNQYVIDVQVRSIRNDVPLTTYREDEIQIRHSDRYLHPLLSGVYQPDGILWNISHE